MNFSTQGMSLLEREKSYENGNKISIGTICYQAGDFADNTEKNSCHS